MDIITKVLELIIKLLEKRDENRKLVLEECVQPLREQFDKIHYEYVDLFHSYRRELESEGVTGSFCNRLAHDLDKIMTIRMDIVAHINSLISVSDVKIDSHKQLLTNLIKKIVNYLSMGDLIETGEIIGIIGLSNLGIIGLSNPGFEKLSILIRNFPDDKVLMINFINFLLGHIQENYRDVTDCFSRLKSFLLTGKN